MRSWVLWFGPDLTQHDTKVQPFGDTRKREQRQCHHYGLCAHVNLQRG